MSKSGRGDGKLLVDDVERAREVRAMIQSKAVGGLSIGFVTTKATRNGKGRNITVSGVRLACQSSTA
jgi:phage head maturation protease